MKEERVEKTAGVGGMLVLTIWWLAWGGRGDKEQDIDLRRLVRGMIISCLTYGLRGRRRRR